MSGRTSRTETFASGTSAAARLADRARAVLPGGNTRHTVHMNPHPPYAARGRGAVIVDADGDERLDFSNNATTLIHGHADPDVTAAVAGQLDAGASFTMPTEHEIALAELLVDRIPSVEQVRFTNSGTEGVLMAVRAARRFTGRRRVLVFEGCYHGSYEGAIDPAAGGSPEFVVAVPYNDLEDPARVVEGEGRDLAAILVDPVPRTAGYAPAEAGFLAGLRELSRASGSLLVFDEVMCLRVGHGGAQERFAVAPDLTTMAKIIGGGLPIGALGGSAEVMAVFDPTGGEPALHHGGTFNGNPLSMVAGLAAMRKLTPDVFARLEDLTGRLRRGVETAMAEFGIRGQVLGLGSLFGIHLHDRPIRNVEDSRLRGDEAEEADRVRSELLARGVFPFTGLSGNVSTAMGDEEVDAFVAAFGEALAAARSR